MTATPDLTEPALDGPETGSTTSAAAVESAREMVSEMADVAGAMFSFLLLQTSARPVHLDIPQPPMADSAAPPPAVAAPSFPLESVALVSIPLTVVADPDRALEPAAMALAAPASIALPASLPIPAPAEDATPAPVPLVAVPSLAIAADVPRSMAMLSEIGFLDD